MSVQPSSRVLSLVGASLSPVCSETEASIVGLEMVSRLADETTSDQSGVLIDETITSLNLTIGKESRIPVRTLLQLDRFKKCLKLDSSEIVADLYDNGLEFALISLETTVRSRKTPLNALLCVEPFGECFAFQIAYIADDVPLFPVLFDPRARATHETAALLTFESVPELASYLASLVRDIALSREVDQCRAEIFQFSRPSGSSHIIDLPPIEGVELVTVQAEKEGEMDGLVAMAVTSDSPSLEEMEAQATALRQANKQLANENAVLGKGVRALESQGPAPSLEGAEASPPQNDMCGFCSKKDFCAFM